jgi:hypothetical protein
MTKQITAKNNKNDHSLSYLKINMMKVVINKQGSDYIVFIYYYRTWKNNTVTHYVLMVYILLYKHFLKTILHI